MVNPLPVVLPEECRKASKILNAFVDPVNGLDRVIPVSVLRNAKGFAIYSVVRASFVISARAGSGIVIARLPDGSWSAPAAIGIAGLGGGFIAGIEQTDFLVVLNSRSAVKSFMATGSIQLGGNLSVAAGPLGRTAEGSASLNTKFKPAALFSYSKSRGIYGGVSVEGTILVDRSDANAKAYGDPSITVKYLLSGVTPPPAWADTLIGTIEKFTSTGRAAEAREADYAAGLEYDAAPPGWGGGRANTPEGVGLGTGYAFRSGSVASLEGGERPKHNRTFSALSWKSGSSGGGGRNSPAAGRKRSGSNAPSLASIGRTGSALSFTSGPGTTKLPNGYGGYGYGSSGAGANPYAEQDAAAHLERATPTRTPPRASSANSLARRRGVEQALIDFSEDREAEEEEEAAAAQVQGRGEEDGYGYGYGDQYGYDSSGRADPFSSPPLSAATSSHFVRHGDAAWPTSAGLGEGGVGEDRFGTGGGDGDGGGAVGRAVALYDFDAVESGDLSFRRGEVITVTKRTPSTDDWWEGKIGPRSGSFPANYIEMVDEA